MPYIDGDYRREVLYRRLEDPENVGELTYLLCALVRDYLLKHGVSYATLSECRAALFNSADELYRRVIAPYEDQKIKDNGDINWPKIG